MRSEDADLVLALDGVPSVRGVYALSKVPVGWPRLIVAMRDDTAHALGIVTGLLIRTLPHRDRSYIGIAGEERLRELWVPLGTRMALTRIERADAVLRAEHRLHAEPATIPQRLEPVDPSPVSVPVFGPFEPGRVWMLNDRRLVVLEVAPDPFRSPAPPPAVLVVTSDERIYSRIKSTAPTRVTLARATSVQLAMESIAQATPRRIVCDESMALGESGLLQRVEALHPELLPAFEIVCPEGSADWLANYLRSRSLPRIRVIEEPLLDEDIDDILERAEAKKTV